MLNEAKSQSSDQESPVEPKESQAMNEDGGVKTWSGRVSRPPDRLYAKSDNKDWIERGDVVVCTLDIVVICASMLRPSKIDY